MLRNSAAAEGLVEAFRRLPGIGKRSAERFVYHLLSSPGKEAEELGEAIRHARERVRLCSVCCNLTEADPCEICTDERRDRSIICVVERPAGAMAIEKGGTFRGLYHVLHGVLNPLEGVGPEELRVKRLFDRLAKNDVAEVIVATNATAEGEATALYLSRELGERGIRVTRIAHGVPMGGGLEFSDDLTLSHALEGRKQM